MVWLCGTKLWWKSQTCYMDSDSFILHVETEDIYEDIPEDVEKGLTLKILN